VQISARGGESLYIPRPEAFYRSPEVSLPRLKSMMMRCAPPLKHSVILITVQGGPTSVKLHFGRLLPGAKSEKEKRKFLNDVKVTFAKVGTRRH
jgi:hypothetical protein